MAASRIEELRRRVQGDPASIAFAQLAEEYRQSGQTDEAVRVCREGLTRHPGYLSARVTLGRALLDLGQLADARGEFQFVVAEAPENLAAVRGLAEIFQRDGNFAEALTYYRRALALARHDPEIEEIVNQLSRQEGVAAAGTSNGLSFEEAHRELLSAAERVPVAATPAPPPARAADAPTAPTAPFDFDRLVAALGTPVAPPQVEAVVAGTPAAVPLTLPDTVELGPNPFAALEAELLAHDAREGPPLAANPEPGRYQVAADAHRGAESEPAPTSPMEVLEDTMLDHPTDVEPALDAVAEAVDASEAPTVMLAVADVASEGVAEPAPVLVDEPPLSLPVATAEPTSEDVLDDLESWLNTLHDRSAS